MNQTYCLIELATGLVVNTVVWDGVEWNGTDGWSPPAGFIAIQSDVASIGWTYVDGQFIPPPEAPVDPLVLANQARAERNSQLKTIYDPGILMAQRAVRMAASPEEVAYAEGKIQELDIYAEALLAIPEQPGFPQAIVWPVVPTK